MEVSGLVIQKKWIVECDHTLKGGVAGFEKLQALAAQPTAIVCSNDMTAIGVMREAYEKDIKIPDDLSVIGFDDIRLAGFTIPPLTTVQMSQMELAKTAFQALLTEVRRESPSLQRTEYELGTNLVLRRSTALARAGKQLGRSGRKPDSAKLVDN